MGVVTSQAAVPSRRDPLMAFIERRPQIMAAGAERTHRLPLVRRMGVVTDSALAFHCRRMSDSLIPEFIDLVTPKAERRLLLEKKAGFIVAVGVMTNRAVPMSGGHLRGHLSSRVAGDTQSIGGTGQQKGVFGGVGVMAKIAAPVAKRLMAERLLALVLQLRMTGSAEGDSGVDQESFVSGTMGVVTFGALAAHEGSVQAGSAHVLIDGLMTLAAQGTLVTNQQSGGFAFVRKVTDGAAAFPNRRMRHPLGSAYPAVTVATQLIGRLAQQGRLSRRRSVAAMASETIPRGRRLMRPRGVRRDIRAQVFKGVACEAKFRRIDLDHARVVAGVGLMTGRAVPLGHGLMQPGPSKGFLHIIVTAITEVAALGRYREGHGRPRAGMTGGALPLGNRRMDPGAEQHGAIGGMTVMTIGTGGRHRITPVFLFEGRRAGLVTTSA